MQPPNNRLISLDTGLKISFSASDELSLSKTFALYISLDLFINKLWYFQIFLIGLTGLGQQLRLNCFLNF